MQGPRYDVGMRVFLLTGFLMVSLTLLCLRMAHLQLLQHAEFASVALAQRFHTVRQNAPRGEILDRNGRPLATSRPAYRLYVLYPAYLPHNGGASPTLLALASVLKLEMARLNEQVRERMDQQRFYEPLLVKDDLSPAEMTMLTELRSGLPGVYLDSHPVRHYPHGDLAAHLLGHLGPIDQEELASNPQHGYVPGDQIGKMGLERQYDQALRGTPGAVDLEVDAAFRPTNRTFPRRESLPGRTVQTTIDLELQQTVQTALVRTLEYVSKHPDWKGIMFPNTNAGAAVVMDVHTGGILAMASFPSFDPNTYAIPRTTATDTAIQAWDRNRLKPLWNRAISTSYVPGSTWKMVTAASALEQRQVSATETVFCGGVYHKIEPKRDWKPDGHGDVDAVAALAHSCNIYFYEMGYRLGIDPLAAMAAEFGFGAPAGIDLPWEAAGWIPDEVRRQEDTDSGSWRGGKLLSTAIGQGPTATPLQLARFAAMLANGGTKVRPHVVTAILDDAGKPVQLLAPAPEGSVQVSPGTMRVLTEGMKAVTEWGTSAWAFHGLSVKVAGKTGTAEVEGVANCDGEPFCAYGLYVAFAPADRPEIAIAVVGERAGHGDSMNPVVRAAVAGYFGLALDRNDPLYTMGILDRPDRP